MSLVDNTIERLALVHSSVAVKGGYADGLIRVTVPNGQHWRISEDGVAHEAGLDFSVDFSTTI